ncbi:MAG: 50S ribosomal protein L25 [Patescibacteria group bacterium]|jgi:large subunit ribosomal protein L25
MTQTEAITLQAKTRTVLGKAVKELRKTGVVPGVVYGHDTTATNIQIDAVALETVYRQAGLGGSLIDLSIDDKKTVPVVIQELTRDYLTDKLEHVDFHAVRMDEVISAQVMLIFTGEAPAVKGLGGTFIKNKDHITIKCLPSKLFKDVTVDISKLKTFEDSVKVSDITLPDGVQVVEQPGEILAVVEPPRSDEELASLNAKVSEDVTKVEGVIKPTAEVEPAPAKTDKK